MFFCEVWESYISGRCVQGGRLWCVVFSCVQADENWNIWVWILQFFGIQYSLFFVFNGSIREIGEGRIFYFFVGLEMLFEVDFAGVWCAGFVLVGLGKFRIGVCNRQFFCFRVLGVVGVELAFLFSGVVRSLVVQQFLLIFMVFLKNGSQGVIGFLESRLVILDVRFLLGIYVFIRLVDIVFVMFQIFCYRL